MSSLLPRLQGLVAERERALRDLLELNAGGIALACHDLARAFARGGVLIAYGTGAAATDAAHVAVEFMHPVIVGKRALPAVAPAEPLRLAHPGDIALGIAHGAPGPDVGAFLAGARERGLLTVLLAGGREPGVPVDHSFAVGSDDPRIVQEVQETAYHVLWELVHVFFEHPGLLDDACITCGDVAVEATVVAVDGRTAFVERDGAREAVAIDLLDDVAEGDVVLCHAGVALERVS